MKKILLAIALLAPNTVMATGVSDAVLELHPMSLFLLLVGFIAIALGISSSGYALSISLGAYAGCDRGRRASAFLPAVLPMAQGIYSLVICFLMIENMAFMTLEVAFAGVLCGVPCLFSALGQAKTAACCIKSINHGHMGLGQALFLTFLLQLYALSGLAVSLLLMV